MDDMDETHEAGPVRGGRNPDEHRSVDEHRSGRRAGSGGRSVRLSTFVLSLALVVALATAAIAWVAGRDSDDDPPPPRPAAGQDTSDDDDGGDDDPLAELLEDGDLDAFAELLDGTGLEGGGLDGGGLGVGGASLECLAGGDLSALVGGERTELPDDPDAQYEAVARLVEAERDLTFEQVPPSVVVDRDEMAERLAALLARDYPPDVERADEELLVALGALEPGTDLRTAYEDLLGGQVAGYYDPHTGEMVVLDDGDGGRDTIELTIVAHELEHALADQALGLPIDDDPRTDDPDGSLAARTLVEGDAMLVQTRFQMTALDPLELLTSGSDPAIAASREALAAAPDVLAAQLVFPYVEGLAFVCDLQADGWEAVDAAYRDPPATTAQVLFPDRYRAGEAPLDPPDPAAPAGGGWEEVRQLTFGAAQLMIMLDAAGVEDARGRVSAWAGGEVWQWRNGDDGAVAVALVERAEHEAPAPLCDTVRMWAEEIDGADVTCDGAHVTLRATA